MAEAFVSVSFETDIKLEVSHSGNPEGPPVEKDPSKVSTSSKVSGKAGERVVKCQIQL